jgi:hypothetical protein
VANNDTFLQLSSLGDAVQMAENDEHSDIWDRLSDESKQEIEKIRHLQQVLQDEYMEQFREKFRCPVATEPIENYVEFDCRESINFFDTNNEEMKNSIFSNDIAFWNQIYDELVCKIGANNVFYSEQDIRSMINVWELEIYPPYFNTNARFGTAICFWLKEDPYDHIDFSEETMIAI